MRWLKIAAVALVVAYIATGIRYSLYKPERSDAFLWVVYHVHSDMSDGLSPVSEIAREARAAGVSAVILTEHGQPNLQSTNFRESIDGVTLIGGSEATLPDGHFTFFGASATPRLRVSTFAPEAMDDARELGAFPVLAYPADYQYGWRYWKPDLHPGGIEILNLFTSLRETSWTSRAMLAAYYPFSHFYFLRDITFPAGSMAHWDDFLQRSRVWAFAASDAHGGFRLIGKWGAFKFPSYEDTFSLAALGVDRRYADDPMRAIRSGDFFVCVRGAGEPRSFEFTATDGDGHATRSGGFASTGAHISAAVDAAGQPVRAILYKDGAAFRSTDAASVDLADAQPGVYRVEFFLTHHPLLRPDVPWLVSNPIFIGVAPAVAAPRPTATAIRTNAAAATHGGKIGD
jgi:hypothetical protein